MRSMGRACADYEEKLLMKQEAAELMYEALDKWRAYAIAQINAGRDRGGECKAIVDALAKAEGRI